MKKFLLFALFLSLCGVASADSVTSVQLTGTVTVSNNGGTPTVNNNATVTITNDGNISSVVYGLWTNYGTWGATTTPGGVYLSGADASMSGGIDLSFTNDQIFVFNSQSGWAPFWYVCGPDPEGCNGSPGSGADLMIQAITNPDGTVWIDVTSSSLAWTFKGTVAGGTQPPVGGDVPEPGSLALLGTGVLGLAELIRRRFRIQVIRE